jgi:hypothetical protein
MKISCWCFLVAAIILIGVTVTIAAPIESVESAGATAAFQKVDAFLCEQAVTDQLAKLGLTPKQAHERLARMSDAQLEQLAAQIDTLQAGGMIQGGNPNTLGPLGCVMKQICDTIVHVIKTIFCFNDIT